MLTHFICQVDIFLSCSVLRLSIKKKKNCKKTYFVNDFHARHGLLSLT